MARSIQKVLGSGITMAAAIAGGAVSLLPATAWADDTWNPDHEHAAFVRNNTTTDFKVSVSQLYSAFGCSAASPSFTYTSGTSNVAVGGGSMVEVLNVNNLFACLNTANVWRVTLSKYGTCTTTHTIDIRGDGSLRADGGTFTSSSSDVALSFCGTTHVVNLFGRGSFHESGVYVTIGTDELSELGPTRDPLNVNKLSVTSYNTFLGTDSKPERCERAALLASALPQIDTDVLVLQEMNLREAGCYDGLELATYLWTGSTNDDYIENDSYARSTSGSGSSPNGDLKDPSVNGAFPYISQFVSGIAVDGNENETGGVVILSKYPVTMVENRTYSERDSAEQKGFIVAKIRKSYGSASKDYYIAATHTSAHDSNGDQLAELGVYLATTGDIPAGARVILAGDLNSNGQAGQLEVLGVDIQYSSLTGLHGDQIHTDFYPYSRDSSVNFYHNNGSEETIDWVQPVTDPLWGSPVLGAHTYAAPASFDWWVFPVRDTSFKFADLSDHFAVTANFTY